MADLPKSIDHSQSWDQFGSGPFAGGGSQGIWNNNSSGDKVMMHVFLFALVGTNCD